MIESTEGESGSFPQEYYFGGAYVQDMEPTFEHFGDAMPENRIKFLNSMGVVGKAIFIPTEDAMK